VETAPSTRTEEPHLPLGRAAAALLACAGRTAVLLARRRVRQPKRNVGVVLRFRDGSRGRVYRETVLPRASLEEPAALVVEFRLRGVHGRLAHALFRIESLCNTPMFVGFPGFVSKLWVAADEHDVYRGVYQWDGAGLAEDYVGALWWVLAPVSVRGSIHHVVVPGVDRDDLVAGLRAGVDR
jgi:hypothetical protein